MNMMRTATLVAAVALLGIRVGAQVPADSVIARQQRALDSLTSLIRSLTVRIEALEHARKAGDTTVVDELAALRAAAAAATSDSASAPKPQQARLGQNALNPEISVTGDFRGYARSPGPQSDPFVPREFEVGFQ